MEKKHDFVKIENFITKQGKKILCIIYTKGAVCSSELAKCLEISRSAMSNALDRLKNAPYELVLVKKQGRLKMYELTPLGIEYVESYIDNKSSDTTNNQKDKKENDECIRECFNELDELNTFWSDYILDCFEKNMEFPQKSDLFKKIQELITYGIKVNLNEYKMSYQEFLYNITNCRTRGFLDDVIQRRTCLNVLWDIVENDWQSAYKIIDMIFEVQDFVSAGGMIKEIEELGIPKKEIPNLLLALQSLVTNALEKMLTKEEFCMVLEAEGAEDGPFVYYVAEKYLIKLKNSRIKNI